MRYIDREEVTRRPTCDLCIPLDSHAARREPQVHRGIRHKACTLSRLARAKAAATAADSMNSA
jgi:hypothetical protein